MFLISAFILIENTLTIPLLLSISSIRIVHLSFRPILTALAKTARTTGIRVGMINSVPNFSIMALSIGTGSLMEIQAFHYVNILTTVVFLCVLVSSKKGNKKNTRSVGPSARH